MKLTRRNFSKLAAPASWQLRRRAVRACLGAGQAAADWNYCAAIRAAGTAGECGIRAVQWAAERMNKDGGIAGRRIELVFEEETNPKDTIERFRRLILQEKVEAVHGLISTGVSLGSRR